MITEYQGEREWSVYIDYLDYSYSLEHLTYDTASYLYEGYKRALEEINQGGRVTLLFFGKEVRFSFQINQEEVQ